jgi:cell division protein FtsB
MTLRERLIIVLFAASLTAVLFLLTPRYKQRAESLSRTTHINATCEDEKAQNEKLREENQRLRKELNKLHETP